jgi:hypothetical protein
MKLKSSKVYKKSNSVNHELLQSADTLTSSVLALVRFGSDKNRRLKSAFRIICDLLNL